MNGFIPMLMVFTAQDSVERDTRLAAAIRFKNLIKHNWRNTSETSNLSDNDRNIIKEQIFGYSLKQNDIKIRRQLYDSISFILNQDFPHKWSNLLNEIGNCFNTQSFQTVFGGANVLLTIYRKYECYSRSHRDNPIEDIITKTFPVLIKMSQELMKVYVDTAKNNNNNSDNNMGIIMQILKPIFRIFYFALKVKKSP